MSTHTLDWLAALDHVLGDLDFVPNAAPVWLTVPESDRRVKVDRLYTKIGLAVTFHQIGDSRNAAPQHGMLLSLCQAQGVRCLTVDPAGHPTKETLGPVINALNRAARLLAKAPDLETQKQELLPRIVDARNRCLTLQDQLSASKVAPSKPADTRLTLRYSRWDRRRQRWRANWTRFKQGWVLFAQNKLAVIGIVMLILYGLAGISHPILRATVWSGEIYNPKTGFDFAVAPHPSPPSWLPQPNNPYHQVNFSHILGTDSLGHDVLGLLLAATTPAYVIGITAALSTALVSVSIGTISAYYGGYLDAALSQISDVFLLLPAPLFVVVFGALLKDYGSVGFGLVYGAVAGAGGAAIVMRTYAKSLVNRPFIEASRVSGGGSAHIILYHILPHMLPLATLYMMISVVGAIVADGFISFFGFDRPFINWGSLIYSGLRFQTIIPAISWNLFLPASLALSLFAASFYLVARGLHQVADPRLRGR